MTAPDPTTSGDVDIDPAVALQQQDEQVPPDHPTAGPEGALTTDDEAQRDSVVNPANS